MANEPNEPKTVQELAQFIRSVPQGDDTVAAASADDDTVVSNEHDDADDLEDETSPNLEEDDDEADVEPDDQAAAQDDAQDDDVDEDEDTDDDAQDDTYVDISDDDLIEVKIDGETVLRSIGDAKKALSGEGAIEKRLKEATEARKQAQADHTQLLEQFSTAHKNLTSALSGLEEIVFQPAVQKPDPSLKQSNPQQYLVQMDDYQADQQRVADGRKAIQELIQKQSETLQEDINTYRQQQSEQLVEKLPEITDPEKAPKLLQSMQDVAINVYGFSPEELKAASDHRMYLMMHDLAKYHNARGKVQRKANTVKDLDGQQNKRPRKLRSGATKLKSEAQKRAKQQKQQMERARQTGRVKDLAATLITRRG